MDNNIKVAITGLQEAYNLMSRFVETHNLSFNDKQRLLDIYRSVKDTNAIIECAEKCASSDIKELSSDAQKLADAAQSLINIFDSKADVIATFDTMKDCDLYLQQFEDARKDAENKALELWEEYKPLNHRLDYWVYQHGYDDEEGYRELEKQCDELKERYNKLHDEAYRLGDVWREQVKKVSGLMYFDITLLQTIANRISRIAMAIIMDINNLNK